mmetsp:Transcript_11874/g.17781  ORF Transcript_11874/g.17781 Transcript_11874/m.17781 type:complete len:500 (+) Transcript_11874:61-1560(+)|eukprot:CAMPEP_0197311168 /NCGR_PEP_ID=MMETSP0891-20130614/9678_1 /TAXON_ID=44058 ORGANISM="Aureoumbra lagunensis, Strain CCMP1510" /NCGR_SAMPLE_ID=MMETSP0891 /ASSEMBLY_ACC=CAM_ASM_000534 /LENGTH=499 /DNA_ID=CAMNT_0042797147 /DNA_START=20 /DNA_END=1519 /DNA_ORIENTATION=-
MYEIQKNEEERHPTIRVVGRFAWLASAVLAIFLVVATTSLPGGEITKLQEEVPVTEDEETTNAKESFHANSYGTGHSQITKFTWPATDPVRVSAFWLQYFPTTPWLVGNESWVDDDCAIYGKVFVGNMSDSAFQLHAVSATRRPDGGVAVKDIEVQFSQAASASIRTGSWPAPSLEFNAALYTEDLDYYAKRFACGDFEILLVTWPLALNDTIKAYSLFVHLPNSLIVIELVSLNPPKELTVKAEWPLSRAYDLPPQRHIAGDTFRGMPTLSIFRVSYPTTRLSEIEQFYIKILDASKQYYQCTHTSCISALKFEYDLQTRLVEVHYVQHDKTTPLIQHIENAWNFAHQNTIHNISAGFDQWMDAHYGHRLGQSKDALRTYMLKADAINATYTIFADYSTVSSSWTTFLYMLTPTGTAIQLVGNLTYAYWPQGMRLFHTCYYLGGQPFLDRSTVEQDGINSTRDFRDHPNWNYLGKSLQSDADQVDSCLEGHSEPVPFL